MRISDWSSDVGSSDLIHAVIGNMTQMPDGKWQALHADKIWSHNSIIGAIYHSYLRTALEKIGYTVELRGKHGTFELVGVPKAAREEFSQRREDIRNKAAETGITSHKGPDQITINTKPEERRVRKEGGR